MALPTTSTYAHTRPRRDALTGEYLSDDTLRSSPVMVVRDRDTRVNYSRRTGQPKSVDGVPIAIESREQYPEGHLGGRKWTPPFARYIAPVLPNVIEAREIAYVRWWEDAYAQGRILARCKERYGEHVGGRAGGVAMAVIRTNAEIADVADATGYAPSYIARMVSLAYRFAFRPASQLASAAAIESRRYAQMRASRDRVREIEREEARELADRVARLRAEVSETSEASAS